MKIFVFGEKKTELSGYYCSPNCLNQAVSVSCPSRLHPIISKKKNQACVLFSGRKKYAFSVRELPHF